MNSQQEIDPYKDLGEENPFGDDENGGKTQDELDLEKVEVELKQAEDENDEDKATLLKKIKQFIEIRQHAGSNNERLSMDNLISNVRKQIDELEINPQNKMNDNFNPLASVENENMFDVHPSRQTDQTRDKRYNQTPYDQGDNYENNRDLENDLEDGYNGQDYMNNKQINLLGSENYDEDPNQNIRASIQNNQYPNQYPYGNQLEGLKNDSRAKAKLDRKSKSSQSPISKREIEKRLVEEPAEEPIEVRRERGIKEIFDFYTRQHLMIGKKATFEQIQYEMSNMNMGEFMKFCKDFKIAVSKQRCAEIFKRTAKNSKEMFLEHFKETFPKLMAMKKKEEVENLEKRLNEVNKLHKRRQKMIKNGLKPAKKKSARKKQKEVDENDANQESKLNIEIDPKKSLNQSKDDVKDSINQKKASISSKPFDSKKSSTNMPIRSMGGDPHGAMAKIEQEQLEKFKKEQEELKSKENDIKTESKDNESVRDKVSLHPLL